MGYHEILSSYHTIYKKKKEFTSYLSNHLTYKSYKMNISKNKLLLGLGAVVIVLIVCLSIWGGYYFFFKDDNKSSDESKKSDQKEKPQSSNAKDSKKESAKQSQKSESKDNLKKPSNDERSNNELLKRIDESTHKSILYLASLDKNFAIFANGMFVNHSNNKPIPDNLLVDTSPILEQQQEDSTYGIKLIVPKDKEHALDLLNKLKDAQKILLDEKQKCQKFIDEHKDALTSHYERTEQAKANIAD